MGHMDAPGRQILPSVQKARRTARRRCLALVRSRSGALLLETMAAVSVFVMVATMALIGVSAAQRARAVVERSALAEAMARNQMEHIFSLAYQTTTAAYPSVQATEGFQVDARQEAVTGDTNLQKITVTITFDSGSREVLVLETLRNND